MRAGGQGDVTSTHVAWEQRKGAPTLSSLLYVKPYLHTITDAGIAFCINGATGEIVYQERVGGNYGPSPLWAAGRIYLLNDAGETTVIADGARFEVLARNTLREKCQATPALSQGRIFIPRRQAPLLHRRPVRTVR